MVFNFFGVLGNVVYLSILYWKKRKWLDEKNTFYLPMHGLFCLLAYRISAAFVI